MAVTYSTAGLTSLASGVLSAIDAGSSAGFLTICTSNNIPLCTITLSYPCGTISGAVLTLGTSQSGTARATGTAASAQINTYANDPVMGGLTVGTASADVVLSTTTVSSGDTITISTATVTVA